MTSQQTKETMEERFDNYIIDFDLSVSEVSDIKNFIRQEISTSFEAGVDEGRRQRVEEIKEFINEEKDWKDKVNATTLLSFLNKK
jgi:hypothetical protein